MITLRRAKDRHHDRRHKQEVWHTFYPADQSDALADGFGTLEIFNEDRRPPGAGVPRHPHRDVEIVTYVRVRIPANPISRSGGTRSEWERE